MARNLNVRQCKKCAATNEPIVQDIVSVIGCAQDEFIYDLKADATLKLRTLQGDKYELWRTVRACDRVLAARELPLVRADTLTRIRSLTGRKLATH